MSEEKKSGLEKQIDRAEARQLARVVAAMPMYLATRRAARAVRGLNSSAEAFADDMRSVALSTASERT